ncbi:MAG: ATP-binding cassette domain-containing protein [Flavobacteriaceae bacterium]|nr:MAG: ATP-binding cassette domain-containing protein [Flavobacteriaceae bacterium]
MIHFNNVTKKYKSITALNNTSFKINENEFVGIVGNNGSGKTTIINALCNLISLDEGEVYFDKKKITHNDHSYKNRLGIILSEHYFIREFNTIEYLHFFAKFQNIYDKDIRKRIEEITALMGIDNINKSIEKLSSGNKMKVSIAASLIHNPNVLVYDEPFVNLDFNTSNKLKDIILSLKGKKTLLITSHHLDLVIDICDKFLILDEGNIIETIMKSDFESNEEIKQLFKDKMIGKKYENQLKWLN